MREVGIGAGIEDEMIGVVVCCVSGCTICRVSDIVVIIGGINGGRSSGGVRV